MRQIQGTHRYSTTLPYVLLLPLQAGRETPLIVALHGMGQSPDVMMEKLGDLTGGQYAWLLPRGPWPYEMRRREGTRIGYAWYTFDGDQSALRAQMDSAGAYLADLHDEVRAEHGTGKSVLIGFSQGGYVAGYIGPQQPGRYSAAACISGRVKHEFLAGAASEALAMPLASFHGGSDERVRASAARDSIEQLKNQGFTHADYFEDVDAEHEISSNMRDALGRWLRRVL